MTPQPASVPLPDIPWHKSPNVSNRGHGIVPYLIVLHRPVGSFTSALATLCDDDRPLRDRVSAHVLTGTNGRAVQLVRWERKAWTCASFNDASYNLEIADEAWAGDWDAFRVAARIVAFLCKRTGIPPVWTLSPHDVPGVCRHYDLGAAGGGHSDPTTDVALWKAFVARVRFEHEHGGFRPTWGVGTLARIDT